MVSEIKNKNIDVFVLVGTHFIFIMLSFHV